MLFLFTTLHSKNCSFLQLREEILSKVKGGREPGLKARSVTDAA